MPKCLLPLLWPHAQIKGGLNPYTISMKEIKTSMLPVVVNESGAWERCLGDRLHVRMRAVLARFNFRQLWRDDGIMPFVARCVSSQRGK